MNIVRTILLLAALQAAGVATAQSTGQAVYRLVANKVVALDAGDGDSRRLGSGVAVSTGRVVTNCHLVGDASAVRVRLGNGVTVEGSVAGRYGELDLCAVDVPSLRTQPAQVVRIADIAVGQPVFAVGNPLGLEQTLSSGLISGIRDSGQFKILQISTPISQGSSGGGLFDSQGRLLGITTSSLKSGQNLNFAIPAQYLEVVTLITPSSQNSSRELTFRGVPMRSSIAQFKEAFPNSTCEPSILENFTNCRGQTSMFDRIATFVASFAQGRLDFVTIRFLALPGKGREVAQGIAEKVTGYFGQPEVLQTDPAISGSLYSWKAKDGGSIKISWCSDVADRLFCPEGSSAEVVLNAPKQKDF